MEDSGKLHCPTCASQMATDEANPDHIKCENGHCFDVPEFIAAQTNRISGLITSAVQMLDEQAAVIMVVMEECSKYPDIPNEKITALWNALIYTEAFADSLEMIMGKQQTPIVPTPPTTEDEDSLGL